MAPKKEKPDSHDRPSGETQPKPPRSKRGKKSTAPPQETPEPGPPQAEKEPGFPIAGIGASAGGLEAFEQFFTNIPAESESGMAFVLVQHLDPTHKSILTDLIKRYTRMEVYEVEDGVAVQPNCAYIIPPNKDMALLRGKLLLMEPGSTRNCKIILKSFPEPTMI